MGAMDGEGGGGGPPPPEGGGSGGCLCLLGFNNIRYYLRVAILNTGMRTAKCHFMPQAKYDYLTRESLLYWHLVSPRVVCVGGLQSQCRLLVAAMLLGNV